MEKKAFRVPTPLLIALAGLLSSCSSTPTSSTPTVTETFTGTVNAQGFSTKTFIAGQAGEVDVTLTALTPQSSITMGLGVGQILTDGSCGFLNYSEAAKVSTVVSGTGSAGTDCVTLYDIGNVSGADNYTLTVVHP